MSTGKRADTTVIGGLGEQFAAEYVERTLGWSVTDRNWRCPIGEIDLVASTVDATVFIEVKTRQGFTAGHPLEAVNHFKQARLMRLANWYITVHRMHEQARVRLDVIGLLVRNESVISLWHVRDALA